MGLNNENFQAKIDEALTSFKKANYEKSIQILKNLEQSKKHFLINWYLGHSYFRLNDYQSAIENIEKSIKLKKPDKLNLNFLAEIFLRTNNYKDSIRLFKRVLKFDKNNLNSLFNLARAHLDIGELDVAERYYNYIIKNDSSNFEAWYEIIRLNKKYLTDDLVKKIEKKENSLNKKDHNYIFAKLILAEKNKTERDYRKELINLLEAHKNFYKSKEKVANQEFNYFTNLLPKFISNIKKTNVKINCDLEPIFVMGLPRSGTTLVEKLISSNEEVKPSGETGVLSKVFYAKNIIKNYESSNLISNFNNEKKDFEILKDAILKQYEQLNINISQKKISDKSIENLLYIDLIKIIFPKAKFIYCKRNKYANFLGILKVFLPNLLWTHSTIKIIQMMNFYENKIKQLINEKKIKIKIIELEELSNDPISVSKDLYNFLNLNWNEKILDNYNDDKNFIKTVSNLQVRKKISKHNLKYLDNYLPLLNNIGIKDLI